MGKCALILAALISSATLAAAQEIELPPYPEKGLKGTVNPKRLPAPENGFISPSGGNMPARGGRELTDEEVMAAVRFMISVSGGAEEALSGLETEPPKEN